MGVLLASYLTSAWAVQVTESSPTYVAPSERVSSSPKPTPEPTAQAKPASLAQGNVGNQNTYSQSSASQTVAAEDTADEVEDFGIVTDSIEPANPLADDRTLLVQELQTLRAKVEEQERQISELKQKSKVLYEDLDRRLQKLAEKLVEIEKAPVVDSSGSEASTTDSIATSDVSSSSDGETDQTRYQKAKALLDEGGRDTEAAIAFLRLLKAHPETPLKPNVYYWLAQIYKRGGENDKAEGYYNRVLEEYPKSIKAASSLYSLASMKASQGQNAKANQLLNKLVAEYPNSAEAIKAKSKLNP